jgi:hypothetical protein
VTAFGATKRAFGTMDRMILRVIFGFADPEL